MRFFRLWLSGVSACCLAFSLPFVSYASVATSSEAVPVASGSNARPATPSEPLPMDPDVLEDRFDTLDPPSFTSDGDSVSNTIDYSGAYLLLEYYDMSHVRKEAKIHLDSRGYASVARPGDCAAVNSFGIYMSPASLPSSGTYDFSISFSSNTGIAYDSCGLYSEKSYENASGVSSYGELSFTQSSGDWHASSIIELGTPKYLSVTVKLSDSSPSNLPIGGYFSVNFTKTNKQPDYIGAGGSQTPEDVSQNIADNTAQQVEQGDTIIELIKNTIQTISSQLTAFWNQLAGEFTNLYNKMTAEHAEDLAKVDEQIEADRQNTDDIIANQDQNTNTITNGYDSSALDQSSNALNDKLTEYDKIESGIHDSASSWISDFTLPDFDNLIDSGGILAACVWLGSFWQDLFTQMGAFNIPVTLSLSLVFVLMLVGYHRFRR